MDTKYASAERAIKEEILKSTKHVSNADYIDSVINALPYIGAILNSNRQIVFANSALLKLSGINPETQVLGLRPGEVLKCVNSSKEIGGCGTSKNCSVCGAVNTILESQKSNKKTRGECRITSTLENETISFEFDVTTTPIKIQGEQYYIYSMVDISNEKRRRILEKIFFHDIINKAGNIRSLTELIISINDEGKLKEMTGLLSDVSNEMLDEIFAQRQLASAENNELDVNYAGVQSLESISLIARQIEHTSVAFEKTVKIDKNTVNTEISTDEVLLKRVLLNMLKNALEASPRNSEVSIGCKIKNRRANFWVHNPTVMPEKVRLQVFMRSFSTKGVDRGLGTYSMKLLGERYLKGLVNFVSTEAEGTIFTLSLPLD